MELTLTPDNYVGNQAVAETEMLGRQNFKCTCEFLFVLSAVLHTEWRSSFLTKLITSPWS